MVTIKRRVARLAVAPVAAALFGFAAAILVAATPVALFESVVMATGLPQAMSVAQPPLGLTARILAILLAFLAVAIVSWIVLTPVEQWLDRDRRRRTPWADDGYADAASLSGAAPVEAARKPIFAPAELGAPLMSDAALATAPPRIADPEFITPDSVLDAPIADEELAAAIPAETLAPPKPWTPTTPADGETSIHALIRRLEAGLARRGGDDPDPDAAGAVPLALSDTWIVSEATVPEMRREEDQPAALFALKSFAWK